MIAGRVPRPAGVERHRNIELIRQGSVTAVRNPRRCRPAVQHADVEWPEVRPKSGATRSRRVNRVAAGVEVAVSPGRDAALPNR
jgi:hypothetical protein